ncbi:FMN-binding glutamate synthase family protein [Granulosicoccus antarcticus]|uniref:Glutamate synthase [NADPH] large chain n=1 Tax=Granulosicoccus antarcticus IMCC3135 TaxID=1192854 RepID=A0A2Z2P6N8_9GAMM|nr:FMN-binding glutamate synthase family protein [Granulosicoccus antarcticus]ASJ76357.1 Glutamate synthase [NADPH] large chain [Granulosicoccus antarcticus IMCC3135]
MRYLPLILVMLAVPVGRLLGTVYPFAGGILFGGALLASIVGVYDLLQTNRAVLKNYPLVARMRFLLEGIRPEIRQYFLESDHDEVPYSREQRALVYRRAKGIEGLRPFGTLKNVNLVGHEWINHSIAPTHIDSSDFRVTIGGGQCSKPYSSSLLNISGMSFGALSPTAIEALNRGAHKGGFAHTTGEGSISRYHLQHGGDLIWQIGSGYFGCRDQQGRFSAENFKLNASQSSVRMIEIKLSQGAKPGHGGILPASKVTMAIAEARGVPIGVDCVSPASHSAFSTPIELMEFLTELRELSGGKPVGIKLCVGHPWEFFAIAKAMLETGTHPDFITVDGAEGGTGAAPVEFADHIGAPLREGLMLVHNTLKGLGIRDKVTIVASGKLVSAFDIARVMALGADACNMARGFMFAIGCIQAQACHTGKCPTGVTSQDPGRYKALNVDRKYQRVASFHGNTLTALKETTEACGLMQPGQFTAHHLMIRINSREVRSAASQYEWLESGDLLEEVNDHPAFRKFWDMASSTSFAAVL